MMYTLLSLIATVLFLTIATSCAIVHFTVPNRPLRLMLFILVVITPVAAVYGFFKSLFVRSKPIPYSDELAKIEDEIEAERAEIFGAKVLHPSLSHHWKSAYLYAAQRSYAAAAKFKPELSEQVFGDARFGVTFTRGITR